MSFLKRILWGALSTCMFLTTSFAHTGSGSARDPLNDAAYKIQMAFGLPSFALSVSVPGLHRMDEIIGKSDLETGDLVTDHSLFRIGSITKTFTADLVLDMVRSGDLSLSDTVGSYLPEYSRWSSVTIEQLINHTSGIYDYISTQNWWPAMFKDRDRRWQAGMLMDLAYAHTEYFSPGEGWHYSNTNYIILGQIVEQIKGEPFSDALSEMVFVPYRLDDTYYGPLSTGAKERLTHAYYMHDHDVSDIDTSWLDAAGGIVSTPVELVRWAEVFFKKESRYLTSTELLAQTDNGQPSTDYHQSSYSAGILRVNSPYGVMWFAPGLTNGFRSAMVNFPCLGITMAYSTNNSVFYLRGFHRYALQEIMAALLADESVKVASERYQKKYHLVKYCASLDKSDAYAFPKF